VNKKLVSENTKESINDKTKEWINTKNIDLKLWDRLIWQEAMDKAIKKNRDKHVQKI